MNSLPTNMEQKQLIFAKTMFDEGQKQTRIRDIFGATQGIKYYMLCFLDQKHPELGIIERCLDGRLTIPSLNHRRLQLLRTAHKSTIKAYFKL